LKILGSIAALVAGLVASTCVAQAQPMSHTPTPAPYASTVGAHARYSKVRINLGPPDLTLTAALIAAGGGSTAFDAQKLVAALTGNGPLAQTELDALTKKFGASNVASFVKTFDFVVTDALAQATTGGIALPTTPVPDPADGKALAAALFAAGVPPRGRFDVEYMLDALVSHVIHVAVMNDIDANPELGPNADANYHAVLGQTMLDLKTAYKL
jgi:hypothetical protein